ncbi:MAG: hypothetical protein HQ525_05695 [Anaerolineae bacterium]|nr:hypothetical protein [Anaerolineae bacterium]
MKNKYHSFLRITLLTLFALSCSLFSSIPMEPQPGVPEAAPQEEVEQPSQSEDIFPISDLPTGIIAKKNGTLSLFDREGYTLTQLNATGLSYVDKSNLHIAKGFSQENTGLSIVYFSIEQNNSLLFNNYGQISTLLSNPNFSGLAGAEGKPIIAFTTAEFSGDSLISNLYVGTTRSLPTAEPVLSDNDPQGWALVALAVDTDNEEPIGVWYSKRPWGIGGDIVFDPRRTLSYLDLQTRVSSQYLGAEANPSAISTDRKWLAYTNDTSVGAGSGAMAVRNVQTGENISYPLLTAVDQRGAGQASFSPGNQFLAWMEGSGWQMAETPNFHSVVRVGNMNGNVIADFADTSFLSISGLGTVQRVEPVGWFDDNTLVIMARGEFWEDAVLILVDIPSKTPRLLAQGVFAGFAYP